MLVLTRKFGEEIVIGDSILVKVLDLNAGRVRIGITAPRDVAVNRTETAFTTDAARSAVIDFGEARGV